MRASAIRFFAASTAFTALTYAAKQMTARSTAICCGLAFLLVCLMAPGAGAADINYRRDAARRYSPALMEQFTYSWVSMPGLPRLYQNHCGFYHGHFVCADHCGIDYQVYFCARSDVGCCQVGHGYCDGSGKLRCSPTLF
jgi:hypothetical protein